MTTPPAYRLRAWQKVVRASRLRKFVGSSKKMRCGSVHVAAAKTTLAGESMRSNHFDAEGSYYMAGTAAWIDRKQLHQPMNEICAIRIKDMHGAI